MQGVSWVVLFLELISKPQQKPENCAESSSYLFDTGFSSQTIQLYILKISTVRKKSSYVKFRENVKINTFYQTDLLKFYHVLLYKPYCLSIIEFIKDNERKDLFIKILIISVKCIAQYLELYLGKLLAFYYCLLQFGKF